MGKTSTLGRRLRQRLRVPPGAAEAAPVALYARILDGERLWLAVSAVSGLGSRLALRDIETGAWVPIPGDVTDHGDHVEFSARVSLTAGDVGFPPEGQASLEVVLVDPDRGDPVPVLPPLSPGGTPTRTPFSRDGRWQFALRPVGGRRLRIVRQVAPPMAWAKAFWRSADSIGFRAELPDGVEPRLLLLSEEGGIVHSVPMRWADGGHEVELVENDTPSEPGAVCRLGVGTPAAWVPLMRERNDLKNPNFAVTLPGVPRSDGSRTALVKLRWHSDGQLELTRPGEEALLEDGGGDDDMATPGQGQDA